MAILYYLFCPFLYFILCNIFTMMLYSVWKVACKKSHLSSYIIFRLASLFAFGMERDTWWPSRPIRSLRYIVTCTRIRTGEDENSHVCVISGATRFHCNCNQVAKSYYEDIYCDPNSHAARWPHDVVTWPQRSIKFHKRPFCLNFWSQ